MRASQLWRWIYHRSAREFSAMRNIARPVLDRLAERCTLARPDIVAEQLSADGAASGSCAWPQPTASTRARRSNASIFRVLRRHARHYPFCVGARDIALGLASPLGARRRG
jgi:hypothetical protein